MRSVAHSKWRSLLAPACGVVLLLATGCASLTVNTLLTSQLKELFPDLNLDIVRIRVINQTGADIDLDLLIDGLPQTIDCTTLLAICDVPLPACPLVIEAVRQRLLDAQGRFIGGLNFNGSEDFIFVQGEFDCDSIIIFRFGDREAEAFVL